MDDIDPAFEPGGPIPDALGIVADLYAEVRAIRLAMEKEVAPFRERETELREYLIANIEKSRAGGGDTGAVGHNYRVQIVDKRVPTVRDWADFHSYIMRMGRPDLLQRRISAKAVTELLDAGAELPGIEEILVPDVSITKK